MEKKQAAYPLALVLGRILSRFQGLVLGKLVLHQISESESISYVRHYDIECEVASTMKGPI